VAAFHLPSWVLKRAKHGFAMPVAEWFRKDLREYAHSILFASDAFLKSALIKQKWDHHQKGKSDHSRALWAAFMLELWCKERKSS
jgi:asparagine synthase (glutamine-hydrolysing)